jgi:DNA polymerase I-like protein with 3'-5' exonuclease and polymerase domains
VAKIYVEGQHDLFKPESNWQAPTSLPIVPDGELVAIDTETNDRGLQKGVGPGWVYNDGWLCGVSWAWAGGSGYAPIRHPDTPNCFDHDLVIAWLEDLCRRCEVVFQNGGYDMGWTGVRPTMPHDTQSMAVLLNENEYEYNLDAICGRLGIAGKDESLLREAVITHGGNPKKIKEFIHKLPARYAGPYAEQDAVSTLEAARKMLPQLAANGLMDAYDLERELTPHVLDMRRRGIRINVDRAEQNRSRIRQLRAQELDLLRAALGPQFRREVTMDDVRSPRWLTMVFTDLGIAFPRTPATEKHEDGQPSFEKEFLERCPHPVAGHIARARAYNDGAEKFIGTYILDFLDRGRLHAEIHQLRSEEGGTRTYRFSYSNPPLQQMNRADPDRANPEHKDFVPGFVDMGTMIRECFEPESGTVWGAPDYSQQEYRLIVHYSARLELRRAERAVEYYRSDPKADYHNFVVSMTGLVRKKAKDANFAKAFGAGIPKFALMTGMSVEEASEVMQTYDAELPFVTDLSGRCKAMADRKGYIRLMDGRRCRFDDWEASWIPKEEWEQGRAAGKRMDACSREEALRRQEDPDHPWRGKRLRRAGTHKAGNRIIQGGAAVQTKKALLACAREGLLPMLQMHDELCFSVGTKAESERPAEIMRDVVPLLVPVRVDNEFGPNWGRAKYTYEEARKLAGLAP